MRKKKKRKQKKTKNDRILGKVTKKKKYWKSDVKSEQTELFTCHLLFFISTISLSKVDFNNIWDFKWRWVLWVPWLFLAIHSYPLSLKVGLLGCILCPYKVDISSCWSANTGTFICRSPEKKITCKLLPTFPAVHRMFCSFYLNRFVR